MMKKVAVFTGTRAEYGLLYWLLKDIQGDPDLSLQLLVTGMHLSPEFGNTYVQIEEDGFMIDEKVEILLSSDTPVGIAKSMGLGVLGFTDALNRLKPDYLVILGDRFEALAAAQVAMVLRIPIVHIHGGEITEGAYDDAFRHAITKLSHIHFTSTEEHRKRVIQLGEAPDRVFNVGAIGLDHLERSPLLSLDELSDSLSFKLNKPYFVVTYHPVTLADEAPEKSFQELLSALDDFGNHQIIITYPNADDGGRKIIPLIDNYKNENSNRVVVVPSLGQKRYLSAIKYADLVIGNSSSGIIEVPSFKVPTINIGERQKGRLAADSVFHCDANKKSICKVIENAIEYKKQLNDKNIVNPYGNGGVSKKILKILKSYIITKVKIFHNL
ncbi:MULTISPECIES: UDP-N-acetylglucosamine 2-epimerase [Pectobacterium]|uniref:UDP-N-acetylglucosamine 2-epimerase n=1 Tax=Pectobacterium TaxID=122277 RepID=UPI000A6B5026|nr:MULTISPECIES: UDP-N-acetylglucosamine 2-epimerase [Pectobacterium]MDE8742027.1 UDP-N-acetylglucosamine 2-epimerase [Pectobacterium polaris]